MFTNLLFRLPLEPRKRRAVDDNDAAKIALVNNRDVSQMRSTYYLKMISQNMSIEMIGFFMHIQGKIRCANRDWNTTPNIYSAFGLWLL